MLNPMVYRVSRYQPYVGKLTACIPSGYEALAKEVARHIDEKLK